MIHLFNEVYIAHDAFGVFNAKSLNRIYITDAEFPVPLAADAHYLRSCNIQGVFTDLSQLDEIDGGRKAFWAKLIAEKPDLSLIVSPAAAAGLLAQFWKSLFRNSTVDSSYLLYVLTVNNDNRMASSDTTSAVMPTNVNFDKETGRIIPLLSKNEFAEIYEKAEVIPEIRDLPLESVSLELLLISYLNDPNNASINRVLFAKIKRILVKGYTEAFIDLALTLQRRYSNFNCSVYDNVDIDFCPFKNISKVESIKWILNENIRNRNVAGVLKEFTLAGMVERYRAAQRAEIFVSNDKSDDLIYLGELLMTEQYAKIIEEDMEDKKRNNVFVYGRYRKKINPLLISYFYRLKRLGKTEQLQAYKLA